MKALLIGGAVLTALVATATAQNIDMTGTWSANAVTGVLQYPQTWVLNQSGQTLSGTMIYTELFLVKATLTGTIVGNHVSLVRSDIEGPAPGFMAQLVGTVATDGNSMSGTYTDNYGGSGTWTATRSTTATATPTQTPTRTPTATATPTRSPVLVGDCTGSGSVNIADILTLVNIVLGNTPGSTCANGIPSGSEVDIALILQAVNHALSG